MLKFFQFEAHKTNLRTELIAGLTTFTAMAYILVVNPMLLGNAGMDPQAVMIATAIAAAIGCFLMAFLANYPIALAPGMGTNAYFAFIIVLGMGIPWQGALSLTFWNGIIFLLLSASGIRKQIIDAVPKGLQVGIQAGIGFFIALLGLKAAGLVQASPATIITHGDFSNPVVLLGLGGLFAICILTVWRIPGAIIISMLALAISGLFILTPESTAQTPTMITTIPENFFALPSGLGETFLQLDWLYPFKNFASLQVLFVLLILDLFDSVGTIIGLSRRAKLLDENEQLPRANRALSADAMASICGALLGTSTTTSYVESAAGIEAGGRTGFTSVVVGLCFLIAIFCYPMIAAIPAIATAPALIFVGLLMGEGLRHVPYEEYTERVTAILTAITIPLFFSVTHGIAIGFLLYIFLRVTSGKARQLHWMTYAIGAMFVLFYIVE
ncbi:NCS2 family permease [Coraliomargarita sp. SDUM461004]|uniref:NCS2 family permease n=1 Tax=Thalassobacterium sedimentorum TaxID=3041258 RepID=A0ABU1AM22_9BACT|nr:NCS2 family permease [Coraliomargarita sp. SDUM461004]MDQ8195836.1 NCS2 family permease [Coraliomargarita sp. SDUM461004]